MYGCGRMGTSYILIHDLVPVMNYDAKKKKKNCEGGCFAHEVL